MALLNICSALPWGLTEKRGATSTQGFSYSTSWPEQFSFEMASAKGPRPSGDLWQMGAELNHWHC